MFVIRERLYAHPVHSNTITMSVDETLIITVREVHKRECYMFRLNALICNHVRCKYIYIQYIYIYI